MTAVRGPASVAMQTAVAQSLVYRYLSQLFVYPDADRWADLRDVRGPFVKSIEASDTTLGECLSTAVAAISTTPLDQAQVAHQLLFPVIESQDCPAYETAYRSRDIWAQTDLMADVAGFYRAHGVRVGLPRPARPDHITVELEFMAFVARKEVIALDMNMPGAATICQETADSFLRDHLGCWGIGFGRRVERLATAPYLVAAGRLLATWLESELANRGVVPADRFDAPIPVAGQEPPEHDDADRWCGGSDAAQIIPVAALTAKRRPNR